MKLRSKTSRLVTSPEENTDPSSINSSLGRLVFIETGRIVVQLVAVFRTFCIHATKASSKPLISCWREIAFCSICLSISAFCLACCSLSRRKSGSSVLSSKAIIW